MLLLVILVGAAILVTTFVGANQLSASLSTVLIGQTIDRTEAEVGQFITPVVKTLGILRTWVRDQRFDSRSGSGARELILPLLQASPELYGALIVDPQRNVLQVNRRGDHWSVVLIDSQPDRPTRIRSLEAESEWDTVAYRFNPSERPWYQSALEAPDGEIRWTEAYRFVESELPGITASTAVVLEDGSRWVIALDVLLEDISTFTRNFDVGYQGLVLVTDDSGQIIGLPNLPRFASQSTRNRAYLKRPHELGFALALDAATAFQPDSEGSVKTQPVRFRSEGRYWWGQAKWIPLNASQELFVGVLVPETELLGSVQQLRLLVLSVVLAVTAFAIYRAIVLSRHYGGPISRLAEDSLRMSHGDLSRADDPIRSSLREVNYLAVAHERMRDGLSSLLKLEDDLKLARQIQQKTFPRHFPRSDDYDLAAGSLPADTTGGDTFDVIGLNHESDGTVLVDQHPQHILMLLSDATGHGIGPALTAAQVRAMFRMGARLGERVDEIARQMNAQLLADTHEGRFVTAWMGQLDTARDRLMSFSAGQAPLLLYRKDGNCFERLGADTPPLGVIDDLETRCREIQLMPGDLLAVISDGLFDARAFDGDRFGQTRAEELIRVHASLSAQEILFKLRDEVGRYLGDTPANDDQTAIIIKRL